MAEKEKEMLLNMLKTGIIGEIWPKATYSIVEIRENDGRVIFKEYYNSNGQGHAEMKMLKDEEFKKQVDKNLAVDIVLTLNYSPCWVCAPKLIEFYKSNKSSIKSFTIRFAHPFNTKNKEERPRNEKCLKNLHEAGITLEAMNEKAWFDLAMKEMFDLDPEKAGERDGNTRKKLEEVLREVSFTGPEYEEFLRKTREMSLLRVSEQKSDSD